MNEKCYSCRFIFLAFQYYKVFIADYKDPNHHRKSITIRKYHFGRWNSIYHWNRLPCSPNPIISRPRLGTSLETIEIDKYSLARQNLSLKFMVRSIVVGRQMGKAILSKQNRNLGSYHYGEYSNVN
jgi:hypothetical protein